MFDIKPSVYNNIKDYKENNLLKEWKIVDFSIRNKINNEKAQDSFNPNKMRVYETDAVVIDIFIKRNINYFIFKILIPVFLILSIAWSVLWIPPNQVESRLTTSIVALLALIAYNFVFNDDLQNYLILQAWTDIFYCLISFVVYQHS